MSSALSNDQELVSNLVACQLVIKQNPGCDRRDRTDRSTGQDGQPAQEYRF